MDIPSRDEFEEAFKALFDTAYNKCRDEFLGALLPNEVLTSGEQRLRILSTSPDLETQELCELVNQFKDPLKALCSLSPKEQTRLRVPVYCHIMEASLPPTVLWNLLRLLTGEKTTWTF